MLGRKLHEDETVLARLKHFFDIRHRPMPERTRVQALVPEGAMVLANAHGTAPGLAIEVRPNPFRRGGQASWLILLPGPPRELRPMFTDTVVPLLRRVLPPPSDFVCRTLRATGIGESLVEAESEPARCSLWLRRAWNWVIARGRARSMCDWRRMGRRNW